MHRELCATSRLGLLGSIAMVAIWISLFAFSQTTDWWTDRDSSILERFVDLCNSGLNSFAEATILVQVTEDGLQKLIGRPEPFVPLVGDIG